MEQYRCFLYMPSWRGQSQFNLFYLWILSYRHLDFQSTRNSWKNRVFLVLSAKVLSGVLCHISFINSKFSFSINVVRDARRMMKYNEMK